MKYKLPVKVIVVKNNELGQIKWEQMALDANPEFGIDLQPIDFALYAHACGASGFTLDDPQNASEVLHRALADPGPAVVQAVVDPNEPPLPGNVSMEQSVRFAKALAKDKDREEILKSIMKDKVREVV